MYNLRHSTARNCIERCFGVIKRRFKIIATAPEYNIKAQARLIHAVCVLHNFILCHDPTDATVYDVVELQRRPPQTQMEDHVHMQGDEMENTLTGMDSEEDIREQMAEEMWAQYQEYIANAS